MPRRARSAATATARRSCPAGRSRREAPRPPRRAGGRSPGSCSLLGLAADRRRARAPTSRCATRGRRTAAAAADGPRPPGRVERAMTPRATARSTTPRSPNATDGDPATSWQTEHYQVGRRSANLKKGVGLVLDAGRAGRSSRSLTVVTRHARVHGGRSRPARLRAGRSRRSRGSQTVGRRTTFQLSVDPARRYYLVWITRLAAGDAARSARQRGDGGARSELAHDAAETRTPKSRTRWQHVPLFSRCSRRGSWRDREHRGRGRPAGRKDTDRRRATRGREFFVLLEGTRRRPLATAGCYRHSGRGTSSARSRWSRTNRGRRP